jgi:hypothetical protein
MVEITSPGVAAIEVYFVKYKQVFGVSARVNGFLEALLWKAPSLGKNIGPNHRCSFPSGLPKIQ